MRFARLILGRRPAGSWIAALPKAVAASADRSLVVGGRHCRWHSSGRRRQQHGGAFSNAHDPRNSRSTRSTSIRSSTNSGSSKHESHQKSHSQHSPPKLHDPGQPHVQFDFFGEPVTFWTSPNEEHHGNNDAVLSHAMAALDGHMLAVVTKGRSCVGGGSEGGVETQGNHAVALGWAEVLRFASVWQDRCPLLTVVAIAPLLAHAGVAYVQQAVDPLLLHTRPAAPGLPQLQCIPLAQQACQQWEERKQLLRQQQQQQKRDKRSTHMNNKSNQLRDDDDDPNNPTHPLPREEFHMQALQYLLRDEHQHALVVLLKCLQQCPGDALALSLAMDLSQTTGQAWAAGQAANSVAAYWFERRGGIIRPSLPGYKVVSSYIALGQAVTGRTVEAEALADQAMSGSKKLSGAIATWALAHIFDATGRISEGISFLANFDGMSNYEGSGWLMTADRLAMFGARFALDREERGGFGRSPALRLYEGHVGRVLHGSGYALPEYTPSHVRQQAPLGWRDFSKSRTVLLEATQRKKEPSWYDRMFGTSPQGDGQGSSETQAKEKEEETTFEVVVDKDKTPSLHQNNEWTPSAEDVLTFLPPTPLYLAESTLLLFRMTLVGTLSRKNERWDNLRNAWRNTVKQHKEAGRTLSFCPLAAVAASMLVPPRETGAEDLPSTRALAHGLYRMGQLLQLGKALSDPDDDSDDDETPSRTRGIILRTVGRGKQESNFWLPASQDLQEEWKKVVETLRIALDGFDEKHGLMDPAQLRFTNTWEMDGRPVLEHAVVYAACKSGDLPSLQLARSICSRGVSMRPSSPEEWWKYSIVLGLLGDQVASEDAMHMSISVGGGEGSR